ncbi:MAG: tRNA (cytidine(34)-2'-O)-methyltransferase [Candidatus Caenarcaniphilales bacterium]|nr:tRNA (cytidine(34)-2'-O)-methyltransferase [Candidatus Caenarcaniphilales bacterium]
MIEIVLYQPEIPPNTGNIGRLCVCNDLRLHLIQPLGFSIEDKYLKRSGMDYWQHLKLNVHESFDALRKNLGFERKYWFFTTKAKSSIWETSFAKDDVLVFGPETRGLPAEILQQNQNYQVLIPMLSTNKRSLNLATSVGIASYEALRQIVSA